jgi:hypothetical protein
MMDNEGDYPGPHGSDRLSGGRSLHDRPVSRLTALNATLTLHPVWMWGLKPAFIGLLAVLAASPVLIVSPLVADAFNVDISKTAVVVVACLVWISATAAYLFARRSGVLDERDRLPRRNAHPKTKALLVGTMPGVEDDAAIPTNAHSDRASDAKASPGQTSPRFVVVSQGFDAVNETEAYPERASSLPPPADSKKAMRVIDLVWPGIHHRDAQRRVAIDHVELRIAGWHRVEEMNRDSSQSETLLSNGLPPPPIPQRLRELLKDYPEHLARIQGDLNDLILNHAKSIPLFEQAIWDLEGRTSAFIREAQAELEAAQEAGDAAAIARAEAKAKLMRRSGNSNDGLKLFFMDDLWDYFEAHKDAFK